MRRSLKGEVLNKTEKEYYSRTVRKKVSAHANPELHRLAQKLMEYCIPVFINLWNQILKVMRYTLPAFFVKKTTLDLFYANVFRRIYLDFIKGKVTCPGSPKQDIASVLRFFKFDNQRTVTILIRYRLYCSP